MNFSFAFSCIFFIVILSIASFNPAEARSLPSLRKLEHGLEKELRTFNIARASKIITRLSRNAPEFYSTDRSGRIGDKKQLLRILATLITQSKPKVPSNFPTKCIIPFLIQNPNKTMNHAKKHCNYSD